VNHAAENLLLESKPRWKGIELVQLTTYPQIVFEKTGPALYGDIHEMNQIGHEDFGKVLGKAVKRAYLRFCQGEKRAIFFELMDSVIIGTSHRLAPRIFTRHTIQEIGREIDYPLLCHAVRGAR